MMHNLIFVSTAQGQRKAASSRSLRELPALPAAKVLGAGSRQ